MGNPLRSITATNKNNDLLNAYVVNKSIFYELCLQANKICAINYDTITLVDLLGFVSVYCRDTFVNISVIKRQEADFKAKEMANKFMRGRKF